MENLIKSTFFKNSHISYAPDDSGVSIGAALLAFNQLSKTKFKPKEITSCYFGPEYSNFQIKTILDQSKIKYENKKNVCEYAAKVLAEGKLIAWFQGKMEFGHRALGNRSILADPRNKKE